MTKLKSLVMLAVMGLLIIGCKTKVDNTSEAEKELASFKKHVNEIKPNLKNIEDISAMLYLSGADFDPDLVLDPNEWEANIQNEDLFAANMGIYIVDGFYQKAYDKRKEAYYSIMAGKSIAAKLDAIDIFDELVLNKLDAGVVTEDSILNHVGNILHDSEVVFKNKNAYRAFASFLIGTYVEKQYILFNNIFNQPVKYSDEEKMMLASRQIIVAREQLKQLPDLIKVVEGLKTDEDSGILYNELLGLAEIHNAVSANNYLNTVKPEDFFRNAKLKEMHQQVNEMRTYLVTGVQ
ncbi:hypothetical protein [Carboxylicivirga sp. N1Y90]|uniref:hypothetical protein n=1 Tax=Carboxylicivirga fragile TaxID=3417571 RepID=UPI003D34D9D5|nr:hypothetical protein [Marinilabiliaceae bacterium N1Y90]